MFQFPGFASRLRAIIGLATDGVAPFGDPGIIACVQLPQAYRSSPRPSSPPCAKASTVRPYALDLNYGVSALIPLHYNTPLVSCQRAGNDDPAWKVRTTPKVFRSEDLLDAPERR